MKIERKIPDLHSWLIAQYGRKDEIGTLSRLWLQECQSDRSDFEAWWRKMAAGKIIAVSVDEAEKEHKCACEKLKAGGYSETFRPYFTLPWMDELQEKSSELHLNNPGVAPSQYLEMLRERMFQEQIKGKRIVYLDTNYWIGLRKVYLKQKDLEYDFLELFCRLHELVKDEKIICPLSFPIFCELLKQTDPETREATAGIIEVLSSGVSLRCIDELMDFEIKKLVSGTVKRLMPFEWEIWTKTAMVEGEIIPICEALSPEENSWAARVFIDGQWYLPFSEMIRSIDPAEVWPGWSDTVKAHNQDFAVLRDLKLKRKDLRDQEVALVFRTWGFKKRLEEIVEQLWKNHSEECVKEMSDPNRPPTRPDPSVLAPVQILGGINAVYVNAGKKVLKENDIYDSLHAAFSLPYCDIFAGDSGLCHALIENHNSFDKAYNAKVCRNAKDLVSELEAI